MGKRDRNEGEGVMEEEGKGEKEERKWLDEGKKM